MAFDQLRNKGLVYIVDDEPLLTELAGEILSQEGFATELFSGAEQALEALSSRAVDPKLLITDCVMHGMNGIELIGQSKKLLPALRTILVSGTIQESYMQAQSIQPDRFLRKPYNVQCLIEAVHDVLR